MRICAKNRLYLSSLSQSIRCDEGGCSWWICASYPWASQPSAWSSRRWWPCPVAWLSVTSAARESPWRSPFFMAGDCRSALGPVERYWSPRCTVDLVFDDAVAENTGNLAAVEPGMDLRWNIEYRPLLQVRVERWCTLTLILWGDETLTVLLTTLVVVSLTRRTYVSGTSCDQKTCLIDEVVLHIVKQFLKVETDSTRGRWGFVALSRK